MRLQEMAQEKFQERVDRIEQKKTQKTKLATIEEKDETARNIPGKISEKRESTQLDKRKHKQTKLGTIEEKVDTVGKSVHADDEI